MTQLPWHPDFETRKAIRLAHLTEPAGGGSFDLPDGEFAGQIIVWDGMEWVPYTGTDVSLTAPPVHNITPQPDRPSVTGFDAAQPSTGGIALTWTAPTRSDGLLGYRLRRRIQSNHETHSMLSADYWYFTVDVDKSATSYSDTRSLRPTLTYYYDIWARYDNGDSDPVTANRKASLSEDTSPLDTPALGSGWAVTDVSWPFNDSTNNYDLSFTLSGRPSPGCRAVAVTMRWPDGRDFFNLDVVWWAPPLVESDVDGSLNRAWAVPSLTQMADGMHIYFPDAVSSGGFPNTPTVLNFAIRVGRESDFPAAALIPTLTPGPPDD